MIDMTFKTAKEGFFDRAKVLKAIDGATVRVLSKFGAYVRTGAKSSIRKRKRPSLPGQPPSSHVGTLKQLIFFSYDFEKKSVVIGPTLSNHPTGAPEVLEHGGEADVTDSVWKTRRGQKTREKRTRRVKIAERPFMGPALDRELPKLPGMWANSVR